LQSNYITLCIGKDNLFMVQLLQRLF